MDGSKKISEADVGFYTISSEFAAPSRNETAPDRVAPSPNVRAKIERLTDGMAVAIAIQGLSAIASVKEFFKKDPKRPWITPKTGH